MPSRRLRIALCAGALTFAVAGAAWVTFDLMTVSDAELDAMPTRELLVLVGREQSDDRDSAGNRAGGKLERRPRAALWGELRDLTKDPQHEVRTGAARTLGDWLRATPPPPAADGTESALVGLLDDPEASVRASAVSALGMWCSTRSLRVSDRLIQVLGELLRSEEARHRKRAAFAVYAIGPAMKELGPALLAVLTRETDGEVRYFVAKALPMVGRDDPRTVGVLIDLLRDPAEGVRYAAAEGLGQFGQDAVTATAALRARLADASEANEVRAVAGMALAEIASGGECADVLQQVIEARPVFEDCVLLLGERDWPIALGRLASKVPGSPAAVAAREQLAEMPNYDEGYALVTASALARIACAERDAVLGAETRTKLEQGMRAPDFEEFLRMGARGDQAVIEAWVELSLWSEMGVDTAAVVHLLDKLAADQKWWVREWATKQRARLP